MSVANAKADRRFCNKSGNIGAYRWGTARKKAMLAWEAAHGARMAG